MSHRSYGTHNSHNSHGLTSGWRMTRPNKNSPACQMQAGLEIANYVVIATAVPTAESRRVDGAIDAILIASNPRTMLESFGSPFRLGRQMAVRWNDHHKTILFLHSHKRVTLSRARRERFGWSTDRTWRHLWHCPALNHHVTVPAVWADHAREPP